MMIGAENHSYTLCREREPKLEFSSGFLTRELREPHRRGGRRLEDPAWMEGTRRTRSSIRTRQGAYALTETKTGSTRPTWVYIRPSMYIL